ncbi:hypothetical protein PPYR_03430 [Photinus pyralis]|uniref:Uncharacterized protein n=1 Tax=Photinus pyralis TaxID=7054 RepID=A0A5N4A2S6_PHOPY|nr:uncharacterized protein LOC116162326 [Photinus pyralis]KAB0791630.1 hypothetical protein PPYR_03430 [Photinus pyralis]
MAKLAVFFFAALAFQAAFATLPEFYGEGKLVNYLDEIRTEVRDLTLVLEKDFPNHEYAIKTVTWQSRKFVEVVEVILNKLREETFTIREDVFQHVIYVLEQVRDSLREITHFHDITKVHELKINFVRCINVVYEHIEKLVHLTYTSYPEFRYTLKYVLVDFINVLHGIRSHFLHINRDFEVVETPRVLIKEIHEYTREFTEILKEFTHPAQIKVALREYLMYVNEIVRKLQEKTILGHKELDLVLNHLTNKLREIVFPLMEIMTENTVDMKVFRTKIVTHLYEIVSIFEQLVQLCEDKVLPVEIRTLVTRIVYNYFHAIKNAIHETRFGYKIGFYTPKYYNNEYYGKHGYGLYEKEFHNRFYTPYNYENKYYGNIEENLYTPYKYESLFPIRKFEVEPFYGKTLESNKYFGGMRYESPKDLVLTVQMLVKRIFERFERNTWEVTDVKTVLFHNIREFITVLDYILEKFETKMTFGNTLYTEKYVEEFIYRIKEIRRELREIISTELLTNLPELKIRFLRCIEVLAAEWCKLIEKYEVQDMERFLIKNIFNRFITFLNKIAYERTYNSFNYPLKDVTGYYSKYYKDNTFVPYIFTHQLRY